jgi:hypothetical protein
LISGTGHEPAGRTVNQSVNGRSAPYGLDWLRMGYRIHAIPFWVDIDLSQGGAMKSASCLALEQDSQVEKLKFRKHLKLAESR